MMTSSLHRLAALVTILLAAAPRLARAAEPAGKAEPQVLSTPISLTVSGAVSLGAYEAGLLHYSLSWLRANAQRAELKLVTGASAGSVNSVLSVFAQCGEPQDAPSESLFWKVWVPLGIDQLFVESKTTRQAAFSRAPFEAAADELEVRWNAGLKESCDVVMGFSATRVVPRNVTVGASEGALTVPRTEERFVLRVQGRGKGKKPRLTNYLEESGIGDPLLLPEDEKGEVPFQALRDLLFASTAFPVAFAPVDLAHCISNREKGKAARCPEASASHALFIDGGLFDNTPLALAVTTATAGLRPGSDGRVHWLDKANASQGKLPPQLNFVYLETDVTTYPLTNRATPINRESSMMSILGRVTAGFMSAARSKNLYTLIEQRPVAGSQIRSTARNYPAASSPMVAFLGFFEREFRRYDFYLGMYDARKLIAERLVPRTGMAHEKFTFPEDAATTPAEWRALACLRALYEGLGDPKVACAGDDLADIRILAQVSLDRLYEECRHPREPDAPPIAHVQCRAASEGGEPPLVPGVAPIVPAGDWRRRAGEPEVNWVIRLLASHGFKFRDLKAEEPEDALVQIREKLGAVVEATADRQPGVESTVMRRAGAMGANALLYVPYKNRVWVGLGRELELGYSRGFPGAPGIWSRFRLDAGLQIQNPYTPISSDEQPWGIVPFAGASFRIPGFDSQAFQLAAVVHGGYVFARGDDFTGGNCTTGNKPITSCSGGVVQGGISAEGFEVVFLRMMVEWFSAGSRWAFGPMLGVQLGF